MPVCVSERYQPQQTQPSLQESRQLHNGTCMGLTKAKAFKSLFIFHTPIIQKQLPKMLPGEALRGRWKPSLDFRG